MDDELGRWEGEVCEVVLCLGGGMRVRGFGRVEREGKELREVEERENSEFQGRRAGRDEVSRFGD
jgi:hypothetical protein